MIQKIYKRKFELIYLSHTKKEFLFSFSSLKSVNSWKVWKKDRRERHSLLNLLMNLQKRLMNQWNIKQQTSLYMYCHTCKNAGAHTDDNNLYFEPKDAEWWDRMVCFRNQFRCEFFLSCHQNHIIGFIFL